MSALAAAAAASAAAFTQTHHSELFTSSDTHGTSSRKYILTLYDIGRSCRCRRCWHRHCCCSCYCYCCCCCCCCCFWCLSRKLVSLEARGVKEEDEKCGTLEKPSLWFTMRFSVLNPFKLLVLWAHCGLFDNSKIAACFQKRNLFTNSDSTQKENFFARYDSECEGNLVDSKSGGCWFHPMLHLCDFGVYFCWCEQVLLIGKNESLAFSYQELHNTRKNSSQWVTTCIGSWNHYYYHKIEEKRAQKFFFTAITLRTTWSGFDFQALLVPWCSGLVVGLMHRCQRSCCHPFHGLVWLWPDLCSIYIKTAASHGLDYNTVPQVPS